ncbi:hypothetical protein [Brevibacillus sp. H7]|uniref:hypothetical protein n=1 Tax=Brevibacillus sp. H7 TaxID=3349138 RepID=UPI0038135C0A
MFIDNVAPEKSEWGLFMNRVEKLRDDSHVCCLTVSRWQDLFDKFGLTEEKARLRKKRFAFSSWVRRTAESEEQVQLVESVLLHADEETARSFDIQIDGGKIVSHQIDEWMVLCTKGDINR